MSRSSSEAVGQRFNLSDEDGRVVGGRLGRELERVDDGLAVPIGRYKSVLETSASSAESSLGRLRDMASVGELRSMEEAERLEVREAEERLLSLDGRSERKGKLYELGELDTLEVDAVGARARGSRRAEKADASRRSSSAADEGGRR